MPHRRPFGRFVVTVRRIASKDEPAAINARRIKREYSVFAGSFQKVSGGRAKRLKCHATSLLNGSIDGSLVHALLILQELVGIGILKKVGRLKTVSINPGDAVCVRNFSN